MQAPKHLKPATAKWFQTVASEFDLQEHHAKLLQAACECWDRLQAAREFLDKNGPTFTDRFGQPCARPEVAIEKDSRIAFARLIRELGLDLAGVPESPRPPRLDGRRT